MWEWLGPLITGGKIVKDEFDRRSQETKKALALYRSLEYKLTRLDDALRSVAANTQYANDSQVRRVRSAAMAVCDEGHKLAELGDTAAWEQLNNVRMLLDWGENFENETGGWTTQYSAKALLDPQFRGLRTLRNHVAWKVQSLAGR